MLNLFEPVSHNFAHHGAVYAVALRSNFAHVPALVAGGAVQQFILTDKGFWFGFRDTVLHAGASKMRPWVVCVFDAKKIVHAFFFSGEGPIRAVSWRGRLIAWANDVGTSFL